MPCRWINAKQIQQLHNQANPDNPIAYATALKMKNNCISRYKDDFGEVQLPNKKEIPLSWYEHYYGEEAFACKKHKKSATPK